MNRSWRWLSVLLVALSAACGGTTQHGAPGGAGATPAPEVGGSGGATGGGSRSAGGAATIVAGSTASAGGSPGDASGEAAGGESPASSDLPAPQDAAKFCGVPGDLVGSVTLASFEAQMVGQWLYCSGPALYLVDHAGIEFTANGHWYFLSATDAGGLARRKGFDGKGTWTLNGSNTMGPSGPQIDLLLAGNGSNPVFITFEENPRGMRLAWMLGNTDYIATSSP
jgi:hypothetical protein